MAIKVNLDVLMAQKKKGLTELAKEVDITLANLSILKNNKAKRSQRQASLQISLVSPRSTPAFRKVQPPGCPSSY